MTELTIAEAAETLLVDLNLYHVPQVLRSTGAGIGSPEFYDEVLYRMAVLTAAIKGTKQPTLEEWAKRGKT